MRAAGAVLAAAALTACAAPLSPPATRVAAAQTAPGCPPPPLGDRFDEPLDPPLDADRVSASILRAANAGRCEAGRAPLSPAPALARAARRYAEAMVEEGFFGHVPPGPDPRRLRDRAEAAGATHALLGENLAALPLHRFGDRRFYEREGACAFSFTPEGPLIPRMSYAALGEAAVAAWMQSEAHRQGLLEPRYAAHGAGAAVAAEEGRCGVVYVAQMFGAEG